MSRNVNTVVLHTPNSTRETEGMVQGPQLARPSRLHSTESSTTLGSPSARCHGGKRSQLRRIRLGKRQTSRGILLSVQCYSAARRAATCPGGSGVGREGHPPGTTALHQSNPKHMDYKPAAGAKRELTRGRGHLLKSCRSLGRQGLFG